MKKGLGSKVLKLIGTISFVSMGLILVMNFVLFKVLFTNIQNEVKQSIVEGTKIINGSTIEKIISDKSMDSTEYKQLQNQMLVFKSDKDLSFFYTLTKSGEKTQFLVDGKISDVSKLGEEYIFTKDIEKAFNGEILYTKKPVKDSYGTFISAYAPIKNSTGKVIAIAAVDKNVEYFINMRKTILVSIGISSIVIMILSIIATTVFSKKITYNAKTIEETLMKMANGEMNTNLNINSKDEFQSIGESINKLSNKCSETLRVIKQTSASLLEDSETLSALSEEMAASTELVSSSVEEVTTRSVEEAREISEVDNNLVKFGTGLNESADFINIANNTVQEMNLEAQKSNEDILILDKSVKDIATAFHDVRQNINNLNVNISQVSEITDLINSIAEQTNLLALNAAIEAARAGEAGRGFSVVAEEIRKLAEKSRESSEGISRLIERVSLDSHIVVETSSDMEDKLNDESKIIQDTIISFKDIISKMGQVSELTVKANSNIGSLNCEKDKILKGVEVVATGSEEVASFTEEILASSQEISSSSQEVAVSSQQLRKKAEEMIGAVNYFTV
ncbi:methyl-accepting chemotaxis protein [Clostridium tunisiense]|uniref:methyl-accepting chemotaxis protein n=1 Tax=Clostridium tunisiense TaxID=219748 RepID=UPI00031FACA2|nr:methyl-accepting chemotaxis protein [Clostridium tunisiense]